MSDSVRTIVQLVVMDETGDSYLRMRWPGKALIEFAPEWRVLNLDANAEERFIWAKEADLLVLYQCADFDLIPILKERQRAGKKTLVEYNDNFYEPPIASPAAEAWRSPLLWQTYEKFMELSDGILVTGVGLEELFSHKTKKPIHILENHYPYEPENFLSLYDAKTLSSGALRIGWAGSLGHISDFLSVLPTLEEIFKKNPNLKFCIMGNSALPSFIHLPAHQVEYTPWGTMADYFQFWKSIHLGVAPLLDTPYNRCRSDIKPIEMASQGVLPILPDTLNYRKLISETGLSPFRTYRKLRERIESYIQNPELIQKEARKIHSYVVKNRVGFRRSERFQLYQEMLAGITPSAFDWKFPTGYHEVSGTKTATAPLQRTLLRIQSTFNAGDKVQSLLIAEEACKENPQNPELALSELKIRLRLKDSKFLSRLQESKNAFPEDLRFKFIELQVAENFESLSEVWNSILSFLQNQNTTYRDFFREDAIKIFLQIIQKDPRATKWMPMMTALYPESAELRYHWGHLLEQSGNHEEALKQFDWLMKAQRQWTANQQFLQKVELKEIESWKAALEKRISG